MRNEWIIADKEGLRKTLGHRGFIMAVPEMVQNAIDENITKVEINLPRPTNGRTTLRVTDDSPDGWHDLSHSYRMFAESYKKANPEKRGRFNIGEKFVLALCDFASISTTVGRVMFNEDGTRTESTRVKREIGTEFLGSMRLLISEWEEMVEAARRIVPPDGITITVNGLAIPHRKPLKSWTANLPSVICDEEGNLRPTKRNTIVTLYAVEQNETATIYEMGIPVVDFECKYHVSIGQKVPLSFNRDNVPDAYRTAVLVEVLNHTAEELTETESSDNWVTTAASDSRCEVIGTVLDKRFGEKRYSYNPSDPESNKIAIADGSTVIHGSTLPAGMWEIARREGAIAPPPPSPKAHFSEYGKGPIPREKWTAGMVAFEKFVTHFAEVVLGRPVSTVIYADSGGQRWMACFSEGSPTLKVAKRECGGNKFFEGGVEAHFREWVELLIHELAHDKVSDHLSSNFHEECCRLGATYAAHLQRKLSANESIADLRGREIEAVL